MKQYREANKSRIDESKREWLKKHAERLKNKRAENYKNNKEHMLENMKMRKRIRHATDIKYKIRCNISRQIHTALTKRRTGKNNLSFLKFVNYSIAELIRHLELQFEPWMNWNNYGKFDQKKWLDNDIYTWSWQIDHIRPVSDFIFTSMTDISFIECWSLSNLRPLSSKINWIDGYTRKRHSK